MPTQQLHGGVVGLNYTSNVIFIPNVSFANLMGPLAQLQCLQQCPQQQLHGGIVRFIYTSYVIISARKEGNDNIPFWQNIAEADSIIGYSYLLLFIIMAAVNVLLVIQIRAKERSESGSNAQ